MADPAFTPPAPTITYFPGCDGASTPSCANRAIIGVPGVAQQMRIGVGLDTVGETYQWQKCLSPTQDCGPESSNWASIVNNDSNPRILAFPVVGASDDAMYRCVVTNAGGVATSPSCRLDVLDGAFIITQPADVIVPPGTPNITYTITAGGLDPPAYLWEHCPVGGDCGAHGAGWAEIDAGNNPSASTPTLKLGAADASEAGYYRCKVNTTAVGDFAYSERAILGLNDPGIFTQLQDLTVDPGQVSGFTLIAVGTPPLSCQWFKDGVPLSPGATGTGATISFNADGDQITIANTQHDDAGAYSVLVSNSLGTLLSRPAALKVNTPPTIVAQPQGVVRQPGETVAFQVLATSGFPIAYQWKKNGVEIANGGDVSGADSDRLEIANLDDSDEALYSVVVANRIGSTASDGARLLVGDPLTVTDCSGGGPSYQLGMATLSVTTVGGKGTRAYQWQRNGVDVGAPIIGQGDPFTATLDLKGLTAANAGTYVCNISDARSAAYGEPYRSCTLPVTVYEHLSVPLVSVNESFVPSVTLLTGEQARFQVVVDGGLPPLMFHWSKDDGTKRLVPAGVGRALEVNDLDFGDAGVYYVNVIDSGSDQQMSEAVTLIVEVGVPVLGGLGLAALAGIAALGGVLAARRK